MPTKITFDPKNKVVYPDKFKPGDYAISKGFVKFSDGTFHQKDGMYLVTEKTKAYYNVCHKEYDKVE